MSSKLSQFPSFKSVCDVPVFQLFLQPIRCLHHNVPRTMRLRGELLMRVVGLDGELQSPVATIARHEMAGTMMMLDLAVIRIAFESLRSQEPLAGRTCINVSACSLSNEKFAWLVHDELENSGVNPATLCFEITETAAISNMRSARHNARALRNLGIAIALDDYQTGYSTEEYLRELPVDYVKISGLHTMPVLEDPASKLRIVHICNAARRIEALTIAECVTQAQQMFLLSELGIDMVQGDAVGPSLPI